MKFWFVAFVNIALLIGCKTPIPAPEGVECTIRSKEHMQCHQLNPENPDTGSWTKTIEQSIGDFCYDLDTRAEMDLHYERLLNEVERLQKKLERCEK